MKRIRNLRDNEQQEKDRCYAKAKGRSPVAKDDPDPIAKADALGTGKMQQVQEWYPPHRRV